jgi:hypothetical protein
MSRLKYLLVVFGGLALAGCAPQAPQPAPAIDSPINSQAAESPPPRMDTLAVSSSARSLQDAAVPPHQLMPEMGPGMGKMGHDMPAMDHGMHHVAPATKPGDNVAPSAPRWTPTTVPTSEPGVATIFTQGHLQRSWEMSHLRNEPHSETRRDANARQRDRRTGTPPPLAGIVWRCSIGSILSSCSQCSSRA